MLECTHWQCVFVGDREGFSPTTESGNEGKKNQQMKTHDDLCHRGQEKVCEWVCVLTVCGQAKRAAGSGSAYERGNCIFLQFIHNSSNSSTIPHALAADTFSLNLWPVQTCIPPTVYYAMVFYLYCWGKKPDRIRSRDDRRGHLFKQRKTRAQLCLIIHHALQWHVSPSNFVTFTWL